MRLKENVSYFYDYDSKKTVINYGIKEFSIVDQQKEYFNQLKRIGLENPGSDLLEFLTDKNLLDASDMANVKTDVARTGIYFADKLPSQTENYSISTIFKTLGEITVVILGCGGIGTVVVDNLVRSGIKKFVLVDGDDVESSNLNRQVFFSTEDIGKKKTKVLYTKLLKLFKDVRITVCSQYIKNTNDLTEILSNKSLNEANSILVNCADTPQNIEEIVARSCQKFEIPFVSGYVGVETGTWGPIYDKKHKYKKESILDGEPLKASLSMTNMTTASLLSKLILDYLMRKVYKTENCFYETHTLDFERMRIDNE
ncbi:HesA/MoeB/ThiF family protein [Lactiplantibacillus plantarum]|uniref:HesA/MoeB/ThiF family protein n=1 Tax=Lactiplantibacillus plantarum TaxID=1590 RepID=UPI000698B878|nr:ThiF family adenylyltransferase [Lactiplantibacillus plantarum]KZV02944.1 Sulfur carrier protein adenylyltransferaseThiF [Lactiplantibacillus plantarum]OEZ36623.1 hypothetical protein A6B36_00070 [Lactiplantibacillus plantarum]WBB05487.1 ThiF family adenylyltransferase [Lactiplantibacillus plantarum]